MMEWLSDVILARYNYWISVVIMLIGVYAMIGKNNLVKKVIGLTIFQTGIFLFFISLGDIIPGTTYIVIDGLEGGITYINPLPTTLILTSIVVSVSVLAYSLALVIRIYEEFGTIEEDEINDILDREDR